MDPELIALIILIVLGIGALGGIAAIILAISFLIWYSRQVRQHLWKMDCPTLGVGQSMRRYLARGFGFPASDRFRRQEPSLFRARGCAPPLLGTWGTRPPARRSAIASPPFGSLLLPRFPYHDSTPPGYFQPFWERSTIRAAGPKRMPP